MYISGGLYFVTHQGLPPKFKMLYTASSFCVAKLEIRSLLSEMATGRHLGVSRSMKRTETVGEKDRDKNAILPKIKIGGNRSRNSVQTDALTSQLYHQWEILTIHKTTAQEMSKIAEKMVDNIAVVQQDYDMMTHTARNYYDRIQAMSPHSQMSKCLKQFVELHERLSQQNKMMHEEFSKLLDPKLRYFFNAEFAIAREKKKKFDKTKYSHDSATSRSRSKTKKEKELEPVKSAYSNVGEDVCTSLQDMNKLAQGQMIDILINYQDILNNNYKSMESWMREAEPSTKIFRDVIRKTQENTPNNRKSSVNVQKPQALTFGVALSTLIQRQNTKIPIIVSDIFNWLEHNHLHVEGLYRVSGPKEPLEKSKRQYDQDAKYSIVNNDNISVNDVHWVCNLLKTYFRSLPDPVIPYNYYSNFIDISDIPEDERVVSLCKLIRSLPVNNFNLLYAITSHCSKISANAAQNMMDSRNLALVLTPGLLRPETPNVNTMVSEMSKANQVFETLLKQGVKMFEMDPDALREMIHKDEEDETPASPEVTESISTTSQEKYDLHPHLQPQSSPLVFSRTMSGVFELHPIIEKMLSPPQTPPLKFSLETVSPPEESNYDAINRETDQTAPKLEPIELRFEQDDLAPYTPPLPRRPLVVEEIPETPPMTPEITRNTLMGSGRVVDENGIPIPPEAPPIGEPMTQLEMLVYSNQLRSKEIVAFIAESTPPSPSGIMRDYESSVIQSFRVSYEPPLVSNKSRDNSQDAIFRFNLHPLSQSLYLFLKSESDWSNPRNLIQCGHLIQPLTRTLEDTCIDMCTNLNVKMEPLRNKMERHVEEALTSYEKMISCLRAVWVESINNEGPKRKTIDALQLSLNIFTISTFNLLWDIEEELQKKDLDEIVQCAQSVVNAASSILKTLYDENREKLEEACDTFTALQKKFGEAVKDRILHLPFTSSQERVHKEIESVMTCGVDLIDVAREPQRVVEEHKQKVTACTRNLLDAIHKITDSFTHTMNRPETKENTQVRTQEMYETACQQLQQLLFTHPEDCFETQKQIIVSTKLLSSELFKLKNGVFSLPDQLKVLEKVIITGSSILECTQGVVDECMVSSMSAISEHDQQTALTFGTQLNRLGFSLDRYLLHIKFFAAGLCLRIPRYDQTKIDLPEAVLELSSVLFSIIEMYSSFESSYSQKDDLTTLYEIYSRPSMMSNSMDTLVTQ